MSEAVPVSSEPPVLTMVFFACGRSYMGAEDGVTSAIARHLESGCKKCLRYQERAERPWRPNPRPEETGA